jgi:hypothetical protein
LKEKKTEDQFANQEKKEKKKRKKEEEERRIGHERTTIASTST